MSPVGSVKDGVAGVSVDEVQNPIPSPCFSYDCAGVHCKLRVSSSLATVFCR